MLGYYNNFPASVHFAETYQTNLSTGKLLKRIVDVFADLNHRNFSFEDVGMPAFHDCTVVFEFGIADGECFRYLDETETEHLNKIADYEKPRVLDWFCGIRYYKNRRENKTPLRFDYYILRVGFDYQEAFEVKVFHERGPRYITPEELSVFLEKIINVNPKKKGLKRAKEIK